MLLFIHKFIIYIYIYKVCLWSLQEHSLRNIVRIQFDNKDTRGAQCRGTKDSATKHKNDKLFKDDFQYEILVVERYTG